MKRLGFLKRNLKINNPDIKSHAYKTLVRDNSLVLQHVWDPQTAKAAIQLEMVQCRAPRWAKNNFVQPSSVTQMLINLKWQDLALKRTDMRLSLTVTDVQNSLQPCPDRSNKIC